MPGEILLYPTTGAPVVYELRNITYELKHSGVAVCMWDDHKTRNALSPNLIAETFATLEHMGRCNDVKAAVWCGRNNWGSGLMLKGDDKVYIPKEITKDYLARGMALDPTDGVLGGLTKAFWDFKKLSIAAVTGFAVGGACNMALMNQHDLVFAATNARFTYPFMKLGITPELGSSFMLPYLIGTARAKELILTAEWFSASKARDYGLVNSLHPPETVVNCAVEKAEEIIQVGAATTLTFTKQVMNGHLRRSLETVFAHEKDIMRRSLHAVGGKPTNPMAKKKAKL
eukprot:TRINITY_DN2848_c0_g1_i1.p1 TRINITY_DN2848_c0_g1~~TRINITY_DN2848_c0_g1_i1.p1  ORF type:complete len:303 (+),score=63.99 TRINITY_DN2848_c0_g1_i1:52-909(+)